MTKKVGITGGIGVGKSYCARIFENFGIPVYDADSRAKWLMANDADVKSQIIKEFGEESYDNEGQLNRQYLADVVFKNEEEIFKINKIVHPAVGMDLVNWFNEITVPYALYEAALMFETGSVSFLDHVIVVDAPLELRIERTMIRDNLSREDVMNRIDKQMPQEEKLKKADFVINNDGSISLIKQIWDIHRQILES